MSDSIDDGGPAFPTTTYEYDRQGNVLPYQCDGMTLRDYFAAKAMHALLSTVNQEDSGNNWPRFCSNIAVDAYAVADAMLAARDER